MKTLFIIASSLIVSVLFAQPARPSDSTGVAVILTEPAGADIYVDSVLVGKSPVTSVIVGRGWHKIRAFYPSVFAWNAVTKQDSLNVSGSGTTEIRLVLDNVVRVQSNPPGSIVRYQGSELGITPLYAQLPSLQAGDLVIQKDGYDSVQVSPGQIQRGFLNVHLSPRNETERLPDVLGVNGRISRDRMLTWASGTTMIVSGIVSAFMKDKANRHFDAYLQNNDQSDLSATRRFDRGAAATLILSQISLGVLAYFLLAE